MTAAGSAAAPGRVRQVLGQKVGVEVPGVRLAVDEDRTCADVGHRERGRAERHGGDDDVVTGLDAEAEQAEVQRRGAAGEGHRVGDAAELGDVGLERVDLRAQGCDPPGVQGCENRRLLLLPHVGRGEVDANPHRREPSAADARAGLASRGRRPAGHRPIVNESLIVPLATTYSPAELVARDAAACRKPWRMSLPSGPCRGVVRGTPGRVGRTA